MTVSNICVMRAKYPQNSPTSITGNLKQKRQHNGHLKLHQNVQVKYKHLQMEQQRTATHVQYMYIRYLVCQPERLLLLPKPKLDVLVDHILQYVDNS
ncbi:hypothetical protein DPMN_098854 [Dreissena polymorpha]|uniref:Uncharacterized protein n=1 Tax=Dreissena polymorpha TaxID=45954 RepID=A0A9D4LEF3_DREPO|nr:hypothetical protein DPMN_098854 [Dreissena polymorpha]